MTLLSVNINKIATLRNSRGQDTPNLSKTAWDIMTYGAQGITIHPRPDERHIKKLDAFELKPLIAKWNSEKQPAIPLEYNIEGYPSQEFLHLIAELRPDQCTLVPDPPDVLTSNAGWNVTKQSEFLVPVLNQLKEWDVRSSLFVDPKDVNSQFLSSLEKLMPDRVELYTEAYAKSFGTTDGKKTLDLYKSAAQDIHALGIGLNAGHDLNQENLKGLIQSIPEIQEVSIGHALICDSLYEGLQMTVTHYLDILKAAHK